MNSDPLWMLILAGFLGALVGGNLAYRFGRWLALWQARARDEWVRQREFALLRERMLEKDR